MSFYGSSGYMFFIPALERQAAQLILDSILPQAPSDLERDYMVEALLPW